MDKKKKKRITNSKSVWILYTPNSTIKTRNKKCSGNNKLVCSQFFQFGSWRFLQIVVFITSVPVHTYSHFHHFYYDNIIVFNFVLFFFSIMNTHTCTHRCFKVLTKNMNQSIKAFDHVGGTPLSVKATLHGLSYFFVFYYREYVM